MGTYFKNGIFKRLVRFIPFYLLALLPLLTACDETMSHFVTPDNLDIISTNTKEKQDVMQVHKLVFSPDHKTFDITTRMYGDIGPYALTDTTKVRVDVNYTTSGILSNKHSVPRLISLRNVKQDNIIKNDVEVLALVDLTQPQEVLDRIHNDIIELRAVFNDSSLHVAFLYGDTISQTRPATHYVLDNYFIADNNNHVLLYRSIIQKYNEMVSHQGVWANAKNMALLIFSDNELYNNATNMPIDPEHYTFEEDIAMKSNHPDPNMIVCYASMKPENKTSNELDNLILKHFCEQTKGLYMQPYNGTDFKNCLLNAFHISPDANEFTFENPDGKVYCGNFETLTVNFYSIENDTLITSFNTVINEGDFYHPIIVNGRPTPVIILSGILLSGLIILLTWLLLQFVIPFISYKLFCHKYVIRYVGHNMGIGKNMVAESCYLCKEPFETGDEVVVKCAHTMHKTCWDENNYHCTEYSDRCKHGSHYYNSQNLLDNQNAPYYMRWILAAIVATTLAWIMFISRSHRVTAFIVNKLVLWFNGIESGTPEAESLLSGNIVSPLPSFGFSMGLFMTFAIAILSSKLLNVRYNLLDYILRAITVAILSFLAFIFINVLVVVAEMQSYAFLLEWIPWVLCAFLIAIIGTYGSRVHLRKWIILPLTIIIIISLYVWWLFYNDNIDYRLMLLIGFIFFGVGLAACIATVAPRSERYFLHVQGAVKEMDIALFKWFRNAPDRVVTIGKSLDCSLQLSWDISGSVAPIHAEIRIRHNAPYLIAREEGVIVNDKSLEIGKEVWLHQGSTFSIANTTFTYIEKDI